MEDQLDAGPVQAPEPELLPGPTAPKVAVEPIREHETNVDTLKAMAESNDPDWPTYVVKGDALLTHSEAQNDFTLAAFTPDLLRDRLSRDVEFWVMTEDGSERTRVPGRLPKTLLHMTAQDYEEAALPFQVPNHSRFGVP